MIRTWMVMLLLAVAAGPAARAKSPRCTLRLHAEANANDSVFATPVTTPITGKNIFIEKIPSISERDVTAFRSYPATDGSFGALFELNDHGRIALETLSMQHRGGTVLVLVNGRVITEFVVDRRISDGRLYLPSGLNATDIQAMEKDWPPRKGGTRTEARSSATKRQQ